MENKVLAEVKHFSHTDADGGACIVMGKRIFSFTSHEFCDYHNVDEKIVAFIREYIDEDGRVINICPYEVILITDISVTQETAMLLDYFKEVVDVDVVLIDHHKTSLYLRDFDWANVNYEIDGQKTSGTSEMYRLLVKENEILSVDTKNQLANFAEQIRRYDTWDWTVLGVDEPRLINELLYIIGRDEFVERFVRDLDTTLTEAEMYLVETEVKRIDRFIAGKQKQMFRAELHGYQVGVVFAEQHHSVLGNTLCKNNPDIDFVVIINMGAAKVSFRSVKKDIDVGEFAKKHYSGGGHPSAAGCEFDLDERAAIFYHLLQSKTQTNN